jgi:hypothetical protein
VIPRRSILFFSAPRDFGPDKANHFRECHGVGGATRALGNRRPSGQLRVLVSSGRSKIRDGPPGPTPIGPRAHQPEDDGDTPWAAFRRSFILRSGTGYLRATGRRGEDIRHPQAVRNQYRSLLMVGVDRRRTAHAHKQTCAKPAKIEYQGQLTSLSTWRKVRTGPAGQLGGELRPTRGRQERKRDQIDGRPEGQKAH